MRNCSASVADRDIPFIDNYCPIDGIFLHLGNMVWHDFKTFDFNIFKIDQSRRLNVSCLVDVFRNATEVQNNCVNVKDTPLHSVNVFKSITIASATRIHINNFLFIMILLGTTY